MISKLNLNLFFNELKKKVPDNFLNVSVNDYLNNYSQNIFKLKVKNYINTNNFPISYIITIKYTKTNTLLSVTNSKGLVYFFSSAGQFVKGKKKISRVIIIKKFLKLLISNLEFLKTKPLALHLKNVNTNKVWLIKFIKKKFFIKTIKLFNIYPHNGCRQKKKKRKKVRSLKKKITRF